MRVGGLRSGWLRSLRPSTQVRWLISALVVAAIAAVGASAALAGATAERPDAGAAQVEAAVGSASLVAVPNALALFEGATVLIAGAGLPPEEPVRISVTDAFGIRWDISGSVTPLPLIASTGGAVVAELAVDQWAVAGIREPGAITLNITTLDDFGDVLATAPLVLCDPGLFGRTLSLQCEPIASAGSGGPVLPVGETHIARSMGLHDGAMELIVGDTPIFGYAAAERIRTPDSQDIVMTIKLGDTILFNDPGLTSSSRNTSVHNFTIDEFGIDVEVPIGERGPSLLFTPDQAGTFRVYCSVHPDDHGTVTLIVES